MNNAEKKWVSRARLRDKKKRRRTKIMVITLSIIILVALLLLLQRSCNGDADNPYIIGAGVTQGAPEVSQTDAQEQDADMFSVELNGYITFENGSSEGVFNIINPASNILHMEVTMTLNDSGLVIYESGLIPPDHFIGSDRLQVSLEKGRYEATALVRLVDPDNPEQQFNQSKFDIIIVVNN